MCWCPQHDCRKQLPAVITAAVATAIPLRLRQILRVEAAAGADQENSTVVMVGGQRLPVGDLADGALSEVQDHEVAALQQSGALPKLQVSDMACVAWRRQAGDKMRALIDKDTMTQTEMIAAGYPSNLLPAAQRYTFTEMMTVIWRVPGLHYIDELVYSWVELNPCDWPTGDEPWELLTVDEFNQLLADAGGAWPQYQQRKLAGQVPLPVTPALPWWPLHRHAAGALSASSSATSSEQEDAQAGDEGLSVPVSPPAAAAEAAPQLGTTGAQAAAAAGRGAGSRKRLRFGDNVKDLIRKQAAPAAASAAGVGAAQGQPADASAGRQQSSPFGSGQEQEQQQQQQTDAEVQAAAWSWMQRVALLLAPTIPPACISLTELQPRAHPAAGD